MKNGIKNIAIIGGGASGVLSAILLKKNCECNVTIFEKQNRILKKVLNTGNGMCNITNENCNDINNIANFYNTDLLNDVFLNFDVNKLKETFDNMGLVINSDSKGRYYPYSKKANTVIDVFLREIENNKIKVLVDTEIVSIEKGFILKDNNHRVYNFDYVIVASGGKSAIGFENNVYDILKRLGHNIVSVKPSLVGFKIKENIKSLSGLRFKAGLSLYKDNQKIASSEGEVQFKDDGISGICVMDLSRYYNRGNYYIEMDLMNDYNEFELNKLINDYYFKYQDINEVLLGIFPKMLASDLIKKVNNIKELVYLIKHYKLTIMDTYGFKFSQVSRGGLSLDMIDHKSLESKLINDLYLCGEVLDVDGACGGYNLHFAWASAYAVARNIGKKVGE